MSTEQKSTGLDWILFLVSTAIMIGLLFILPEWFWVALPFSLTYLVRAMKLM